MTWVAMDPPTEPPTSPGKPKTLRATVKKAGKGLALGGASGTGLLGVLYLLWQMGLLPTPASAAVEEEREKFHGAAHVEIHRRLDASDDAMKDIGKDVKRLLQRIPPRKGQREDEADE